MVERDARGDSAGDGDEGADGRGLVETEYSHAYVAMGLLHSHPKQTALLARVYNLDLAACFVSAIVEVLGVPLREGGIWAPADDAGQALHLKFGDLLHGHRVHVAPDLDGKPLSDFTRAEVVNAETAETLAECQDFLLSVLGDDNLPLITEVLPE